MSSLCLTCNSLCFSGSRRHEHRHRFVGPVNPACVFSGCNLTADGCVCSSLSCDDHFTYINRSQCQRAAGNTAHHTEQDLMCASDVDKGLQTCAGFFQLTEDVRTTFTSICKRCHRMENCIYLGIAE